jgi:hypothetical protein
MYTPPGTPRSRSFTRLTMRVGLLHFGQSVLFEVSITFLRSAVLAILAIESISPQQIKLRAGRRPQRAFSASRIAAARLLKDVVRETMQKDVDPLGTSLHDPPGGFRYTQITNPSSRRGLLA